MKIDLLNKMYNPITAAPFRNSDSYVEIVPCEELKAFVRCFWGTPYPIRSDVLSENEKGMVIPDTCMDIIFRVNYTDNTIVSHFCGINDSLFKSISHGGNDIVSIFGIRFYAWSAILFSEESMADVKNKYLDGQSHYSKITKSIEHYLFDVQSIANRVNLAQRVLTDKLPAERISPILCNSIMEILKKKGNVKVFDLAKDIHLSSRQLERIYNENIGLSPKKLASLIRYQYLWNDILYDAQYNIHDAVFKYGFTDQAHLLREFKLYHGMLPKDAINYALE